MEDYITLNKKNTELLINISDADRLNILKKNRYSMQLDMISDYIDKDKPLLDIGIRDGAFLEWLKELGFSDLYGVDVYERTIEITKAKGIDCEVADVQCLDLGRRFDVIVMSHVLEHCPNPDIVLENVYNHLNENGILFIEVPIEQGKPRPTEKDAHYFNFNSFNDMLNLLGNKWSILEKFISKKRIKVVLRRL